MVAPETLKAAAALKVATKLLKAGLVREIKAKTGMKAWHGAGCCTPATTSGRP